MAICAGPLYFCSTPKLQPFDFFLPHTPYLPYAHSQGASLMSGRVFIKTDRKTTRKHRNKPYLYLIATNADAPFIIDILVNFFFPRKNALRNNNEIFFRILLLGKKSPSKNPDDDSKEGWGWGRTSSVSYKMLLMLSNNGRIKSVRVMVDAFKKMRRATLEAANRNTKKGDLMVYDEGALEFVQQQL